MSAVLRIRSVRGGYGAEPVLRKINFTVRQGECLCVLGPNGAGKTTLLRGISGQLPDCTGAVGLDGTDIQALATYERARLGIAHVPEGRGVLEHLTIRDNLLLGAYPSRHMGREALRRRLEGVLIAFPALRDRMESRATILSGGERQMLAISRALMSKPRVLLLDEPSLGLAPKVIQELSRNLRVLIEGGTSVLLVEQSVVAAQLVADRIGVLRGGQLTEIEDSTSLDAADLIDAAYADGLDGLEMVNGRVLPTRNSDLKP